MQTTKIRILITQFGDAHFPSEDPRNTSSLDPQRIVQLTYKRSPMPIAAHMSTKYKHPAPFLSSLIDKQIVVRLKWGMEYVGVLVSFDQRMNLQLKDAQEFVNGEMQANIGTLCLRCNNILHIREKPDVYPTEPIPDDAVEEDE